MPYSFCSILLVLGLPWLDFREKLLTFLLRLMREEASSDTFRTKNSIDFTSDSWMRSLDRRKSGEHTST